MQVFIEKMRDSVDSLRFRHSNLTIFADYCYKMLTDHTNPKGENMTKTSLFLMSSLCGIALLTAGCTTCPTGTHKYHNEQKMQGKHHQKHQDKSNLKKYDESVHAKMYTKSSRGGESEMGFIKFNETDDGLNMTVDLVDLRPGKVHSAQVYQCSACDNGVCCAAEAMSVDLPQIKTHKKGRLQESYKVQGLTATQLSNAKLILTRDGGHKAAWGKLKD